MLLPIQQISGKPLAVPHPEKRNIQLIHTDARSAWFQHIMEVRAAAYKTDNHEVLTDLFDAYSDLYVCLVDGKAVGTIRATRRSEGALEAERYYNAELIRHYAGCITSAGRFAILPEFSQMPLGLASFMIRNAWNHQIGLGIRLDVTNINERALCYYIKLGYRVLKDSFFIHPVLKTRSYAVVLGACPSWGGIFRDRTDLLATGTSIQQFKPYLQ